MVRVYILFKNIIWSILLSTLENFQYKLERNIHFIVLGVFYKYYFVQKSWQYCSNPSYSCWYLCLYICSISHWEWDIKKMLNYDRGFDFIFVLQILILFLLGEYTFKICLPDELTLLSLWNALFISGSTLCLRSTLSDINITTQLGNIDFKVSGYICGSNI